MGIANAAVGVSLRTLEPAAGREHFLGNLIDVLRSAEIMV